MARNYIIYVEDDEFQAKLFSHIISKEIENFGYHLITLKSGTQAMQFFLDDENKAKIRLREVGLILLDLAMHDISGFQILKELQKYKINIPVAILSAKEEQEIQNEAKRLGAVEYFVKGKDANEITRLRSFIVGSMNS
jgi:CheY-like chemotaxis protein